MHDPGSPIQGGTFRGRDRAGGAPIDARACDSGGDCVIENDLSRRHGMDSVGDAGEKVEVVGDHHRGEMQVLKGETDRFSSRKLAGDPVLELRKIAPGEDVHGDSASLCRAVPLYRGTEGHFFPHGGAEQPIIGILEQKADLCPPSC